MRPTTTPDEISEVERDALERSIAVMLRHRERIYREGFKRRLTEAKEPWSEIGRHAASTCQCESLGLKPWQMVPCDAEPGEIDAPGFEHRRTGAASALVGRLLAAGLSRYEPDPLGALEAVERASAEKARRDVRVDDGTSEPRVSEKRSSPPSQPDPR
jgi:hypothetical protein